MELKLHGIDVWNRATIADGSKLNATTISPLFKNDCILASAVNSYVASGADFSATEWPVLRDNVIPSANNYEKYFGELSNNSANWNDAAKTVDSNMESKWDPTYTTVSSGRTIWNAAILSAQSGYAASAWLSQHSLEYTLPTTQAINFAPDGEWNAAADNSMLIHRGSPCENNKADSIRPTYGSNKTFTIKGGQHVNINKENELSVIAMEECGYYNDGKISKSIALEYDTPEVGTEECVYFGLHKNSSKKNSQSLINSYNFANGLSATLAIGPNPQSLTNCISTTYGQQVQDNKNAILSWKGANVHNSIAIKGALWKKYDSAPSHTYWDGSIDGDSTVSGLSWDSININNCYYRNIKGLDGINGFATHYPFVSAENSMIMATSGNHGYNFGSATNSVIALDSFYEASTVINNSIINVSSCNIPEGNFDNAIILGANGYYEAGTKNSILLQSGTHLYGTYTYKSNSVIELGGEKAVKANYSIDLGSNQGLDDGLTYSLLVASRVGSFKDVEHVRDFIVGNDLDINSNDHLGVISNARLGTDSTNNFIVGSKFGVDNSRYNVLITDNSIVSAANNNIGICHDANCKRTNCSITIGGDQTSTTNTSIFASIVNDDFRVLKAFNYSVANGKKHINDRGHRSTYSENYYNDDIIDSLLNIQTHSDQTYFGCTSAVYATIINADITKATQVSATMDNIVMNGGITTLSGNRGTAWGYDPAASNLFTNGSGNLIESDKYYTNAKLRNEFITGDDNTIHNVKNSVICGSKNSVADDAHNADTVAGPIIIGDSNALSDTRDTYGKNGNSMIAIGNNFKYSQTTSEYSVTGGIHIGENLNYATDTKFQSLLTKLKQTMYEVFTHQGHESKPMILSKSDGAYFVCFKGLRSDGANITQMYFRRKSDDAWYDVIQGKTL